MFWQRVSFALLAGTIVAATAMPVRAQDDKAAPEKVAAPAAAPAPAADTTCYRTVCCTEWVPVKYNVERTTYKVEYKEEKYTAWKCETIQVPKERTVTYYEMVPEKRKEIRTICKCINVEEERTVMEKFTVCKPVEKVTRKCVDKGHWECRCVEVKPSCLHKLFHHDDCCEPCPKFKTKKVWVPCKVWEEHKCTVMVKSTECRPVKVKCCVKKMVEEKQEVEVTVCKCVAKTRVEKYTCCETRKVPCEATRCVKVCVPVKETVECCKMEKRTVMKQVPIEPCCEPCPRKCHSHKSCCH